MVLQICHKQVHLYRYFGQNYLTLQPVLVLSGTLVRHSHVLHDSVNSSTSELVFEMGIKFPSQTNVVPLTLSGFLPSAGQHGGVLIHQRRKALDDNHPSIIFADEVECGSSGLSMPLLST